jgi:uncharacterized protein YoxC
MPNVNHETLKLVFVALTGLAVLLQALILLAIFIALRKTAQQVHEQVEDLRSTITPILTESREFLARVGPKLDSVAGDLAELAHGLRAQSVELQATTTEMLDRVRRQSSRVDAMFTSVLDTVDRASGVVSQKVRIPMRQLSAIAASIKAVVSTLRNGTPSPAQTHSPADKDMFV